MSWPQSWAEVFLAPHQEASAMPRTATATQPETLAPADRGFLLRLQRQALQYFLDNQTPSGLVLDRQRNHGPRLASGLCSTASTGMGFIALALAAAPPYRLLSRREAILRVSHGLRVALDRVPHNQGMLPHFLDPDARTIRGDDHFSTVDASWLVAGALWSAAFLEDAGLEILANCLYSRIDWSYWTAPDGLLRHGKSSDGRFLPHSWDRLNGETAF